MYGDTSNMKTDTSSKYLDTPTSTGARQFWQYINKFDSRQLFSVNLYSIMH
jgi:hypothetical protein